MEVIIDINVEYQFSTLIKRVIQNDKITTKIWFCLKSPWSDLSKYLQLTIKKQFQKLIFYQQTCKCLKLTYFTVTLIVS